MWPAGEQLNEVPQGSPSSGTADIPSDVPNASLFTQRSLTLLGFAFRRLAMAEEEWRGAGDRQVYELEKYKLTGSTRHAGLGFWRNDKARDTANCRPSVASGDGMEERRGGGGNGSPGRAGHLSLWLASVEINEAS